MQRLAETCEGIAATTKKTEKTAIVAEYLRSREIVDAVISAVFLSGRAFPAFDERTLQIGGALSDYTFAVRKGEELVNIGKAYSGLTDKEIAELTQWFLAHTMIDYGHLREV